MPDPETKVEDVVGVLAGAMGALGGADKELSRWDIRDKERDARDKLELDNLHKHRASVDAEAKRSNDLHAEWNAESKRFHDVALANDKERMTLIEREVKALEAIASALKK